MGLLRWFGPSREEIWRQLSAEIEADYVKGGFWKGDKVEARHQHWTVTLDTYQVSNGKQTTTYTRMRAPYVNPGGFRFTIYRKGFFSDIAKWFGMQDVQVGHEPFDTDFIIKGSSELRLCELFSNPRIRDLISQQPEICFTVKDDEGWFGPKFGENVDELRFTCHGVIKDVQRLKLLFSLFAETLEQLCRMGTAYVEDPGVKV
jgi:hypothetical protein